jgi:glycosyltransferase involved in cell wall biosynthesis
VAWLAAQSDIRWISANDAGMYDAMNKAVARASGDVIGWLNADEQYLPGALSGALRWLHDRPEIDVAIGHAVVVDTTGRFVCLRKAMTPHRQHTQISGNLSFLTCGAFIRRRVFTERGLWFDPAWRASGDAEWVTRAIDAGVRMGVYPEVVAAFTDTGRNLSTTSVGMMEREQRRQQASRWVRLVGLLITAQHRVRKLLRGAYFASPFTYAIYTRESRCSRRVFSVRRPWPFWRRAPNLQEV